MGRFERLAALLPPPPEPSTSVVPTYTLAEPAPPPKPTLPPTVLAWRAWTVDGRRVRSVAKGDFWVPLQVNTAKCSVARHGAPVVSCHCGYYGMRNLEDLLRQTDYNEDRHMIGLVYLWGKTAVHDDGFRAEHCAIAAFLETSSVPVPRHELTPQRVAGFSKRDHELASAYEVPLLEAR